MKVIIAGSRDFDDTKLLTEVLDELLFHRGISEVISGTARGADTLGAEWAHKNSIRVTEMPAEWQLYGRGAGHKRNREMGDYGDYLVAFWDSKSPGTKGMIDYMRKLKKPSKVITYKEIEDEW